MNRNQLGAHQQPYGSHGIQHREIGLRAVAAAVLYQGGNVERPVSRDLPAPPAVATPASDHEAGGSENSARIHR
jgi:hypothetical protein